MILYFVVFVIFFIWEFIKIDYGIINILSFVSGGFIECFGEGKMYIFISVDFYYMYMYFYLL